MYEDTYTKRNREKRKKRWTVFSSGVTGDAYIVRKLSQLNMAIIMLLSCGTIEAFIRGDDTAPSPDSTPTFSHRRWLCSQYVDWVYPEAVRCHDIPRSTLALCVRIQTNLPTSKLSRQKFAGNSTTTPLKNTIRPGGHGPNRRGFTWLFRANAVLRSIVLLRDGAVTATSDRSLNTFSTLGIIIPTFSEIWGNKIRPIQHSGNYISRR